MPTKPTTKAKPVNVAFMLPAEIDADDYVPNPYRGDDSVLAVTD